MKHTNKKGFTIVELVIVIAVIAILAAVLIPTFTNLIKKANQSADQQAVTNMNKLLTAESLAGNTPTRIQTVKAILDVNGYNHKLDPLFKGYHFAWIAEKNVIVLVEGDKVVFPKEYANYDFAKVELFNVVKVNSAEDIKNLANGTFADINGLNSIVLENSMNLLDLNDYLAFDDAGDIEIDGNGNTIEGNLKVNSGTSLTLTNITIDATNSSKPGNSAVKPLAGSVYITNTTIKAQMYAFGQNVGEAVEETDDVDCVVTNTTMDALSALYIGQGDWVFENCTFNGTVTIAGGANVTFNNCTFTAKEGGGYDNLTPQESGCYYSSNAIVIIQGRNANAYESGTVTFNGCTVTNANGVVENYAFLTWQGDANPNTIAVKWN